MRILIPRPLLIIYVAIAVLSGCTNPIPTNPVEEAKISTHWENAAETESTVTVVRSNAAAPEHSYLPLDTLHLFLSGGLAETMKRTLTFSTDSGAGSQVFSNDNVLSNSDSEITITVPYQWRKRRHCRFSIETTTDTVHSRFFSVKSLILQKPETGMVFHPGDTMEIRWRTRDTFSVAAYLRALRATESKLLMSEASVTPQMDEWPAIWPSFFYIVEEDDLCEECVLSIEDYLDPVISDYSLGFSITPSGAASVGVY